MIYYKYISYYASRWMLFFLLFSLLSIPVRAEETKFPCEVQDMTTLQSIFFLKQGSYVETSPTIIKKKVKIRVRAWFSDSMATDENVRPNAKFYDSLGNEIGRTIRAISPERFTRNDSNGKMMIELFGYVNDFIIAPENTIEFKLSTFLNKQKKEYVFKDLEKHLIENHYQLWNIDTHFVTYVIDEYPVDVIHPGRRIVMIFIKDELAAIIYSRSLRIKYYESQAESKPYKIYYLKKMRDDEKRKIANVFFKQIRRN